MIDPIRFLNMTNPSYGWPSKNRGGVFYPPNHPFVHRVFHEINHPFWGTTIFGNTHIDMKANNFCDSSISAI